MTGFLIIGILGLAAVLWVLLDRREKRYAERGQPRLSALRLMAAAAGLLAVLLSAGCSVVFLMATRGDAEHYVNLPGVLILTGPPFVVGLIASWLAMRRKSG